MAALRNDVGGGICFIVAPKVSFVLTVDSVRNSRVNKMFFVIVI